MNGTTVLRTAPPQPFLRSLQIVASLDFLSPSFIARGGRVGSAGIATVDGKFYRTVVISDYSAVPLRLFIDPQTSLVRLARDATGNETFEYRDYRRVGGLLLPFNVLHDGQTFERYDDRAVVSSPFVAPHGPLPKFRGAADAIPIDPKAVTPIVDCEIGGIAARCLVDTGNSGLSVSSELASRLGAPVVGAYQILGLADMKRR